MERKSSRDRITELPEFIIHQILSYLPYKEAVRTSCLSKTWLQSYSTFPNLYFDEFHWKKQGIKEANYPFFNFVHNTLLRYKTLNLRIHKFHISVDSLYHESAHHLLDKSLELAFDNCVQDLNIEATLEYTLPMSIFDSPKVLNFLRVYHCKFPQTLVTTPKCNAITFPILKTLDLISVHIDDEMLQKLLSSTPSLENILFSSVCGFKRFRVNKLVKLKRIEIQWRGRIVEIDIKDVPNLHTISCFTPNSLLNIGCAQNLRCLDLDKVNINDNFLKDLGSKFPFLEKLIIFSCDGLERINIRSHSLKHLSLKHCNNLVEAEIDASNLLEFGYHGKTMLSLSLNNTPVELMPHIYICDAPNQLSNAWFFQLGERLKRVIRARVSFYFLYLYIKFDFDMGPNAIFLEHHENFMAEIYSSDSLLVVLAKTLFSFRPTTIESCSLMETSIDFMKFIGSELTRATRNSNCCSSDRNKCWRYYLKDIKAEIYEKSQEVWQPLHQDTLRSEFTVPKAMIRFGLTWFPILNA